MKKLIIFIALASLVGTLVGCGAKEEGDTSKTPATTEGKPIADKPSDDKAAATGTTGAPGNTNAPAGTGSTPSTSPPSTDKPSDDKAAVGK